MKSMRIYEESKAELLAEAKTFGFPQLVSILERGKKNALVLNADEAVLIVDLLIFMRSRLELQYPYFDEDNPNYNPEHDIMVDDFVGSMLQKTLSTLKADFDVLLPGERNSA